MPDPEDSDTEDAGKARGRDFAWFRLHVKLAPNHGPVSLLIDLPVAQTTTMSLGSQGPSVDVFANGRHIQPEGSHGDDPDHYQSISRIYNLNLAPSETSSLLSCAPSAFRLGWVPTPAFLPPARCA